MARGSSIHFEKTKPTSVAETTRTFKKEQTYLLPKNFRKENEFWIANNIEDLENADREIFNELIKNAKGKGKRPTFENSTYEAVVNLESHHTMEDLKKLAQKIEEDFGFSCSRISIHRDEGHLKKNEKGVEYPLYNFHAHLNFITIDENGKQCWQPRGMHPKKWLEKLSKLQDDTAKILNMRRGISGGKRLNHKEFRQVKKLQDSVREELKAENTIENARKKFLGFLSVVDEERLETEITKVEKATYLKAQNAERERIKKLNEENFKWQKNKKEELEKLEEARAEENENKKKELEEKIIAAEEEKKYLSLAIKATLEREEEARKILNATDAKSLLQEKESLQRKNKDLEEANEELEKKLKEANEELENNEDEIKSLKSNLSLAKDTAEILTKTNERLETENKTLKEELERARNFIKFLFDGLKQNWETAVKNVMRFSFNKIPDDDKINKIKQEIEKPNYNQNCNDYSSNENRTLRMR